jgi:D-alanyl-lipoteichoic acid acyltransferase DltB (MBOAT superfamily)
MLLGGLWHGANWTFVVWGGAHGLCLVVEKWITDRFANVRVASALRPLVTALQWLVVFHCVTLLWVVFRCSDFGQCVDYFKGLLKGGASVESAHVRVLVLSTLLLFGLDLVHRLTSSDSVFSRWGFWPRSFAHAAMACLVITLWPSKYAPFIYFQF